MSKTNLTVSRLHELLHYDLATGIFTWKTQRNQIAVVGSGAGHIEAKGYRSICIDGKDFKAHRLAWLYVYGRWPQKQIDHKNRIKNDNRILNLREVTNSENQMNTKIKNTNTSGIKGVYFDAASKKWRAQISINKKKIGLGRFALKEQAAEARKNAEHNLLN